MVCTIKPHTLDEYNFGKSKHLIDTVRKTSSKNQTSKNQTMTITIDFCKTLHILTLDSDELTNQNIPVFRSEARRIYDSFNSEVNSVEDLRETVAQSKTFLSE